MAKGEHEELVGVFHDRDQAEAAAEGAQALGVADEDVHIQRQEDKVASLRGEMREELERSWFSPQGGILLTKRSLKGMAAVSPVAVVAGILLLLPFAFIAWGLPLWGRILLTTVVGAIAGGTVGFIVGGGEAEKGAGAPMAAEHGVTVRVADARPEVQARLADAEPVRLDVVTPEGTPVASVSSESERNDEGVIEDLKRAWDEPDRDLHDEHEDLSQRD
jgi:hypothetical protein